MATAGPPHEAMALLRRSFSLDRDWASLQDRPLRQLGGAELRFCTPSATAAVTGSLRGRRSGGESQGVVLQWRLRHCVGRAGGIASFSSCVPSPYSSFPSPSSAFRFQRSRAAARQAATRQAIRGWRRLQVVRPVVAAEIQSELRVGRGAPMWLGRPHEERLPAVRAMPGWPAWRGSWNWGDQQQQQQDQKRKEEGEEKQGEVGAQLQQQVDGARQGDGDGSGETCAEQGEINAVGENVFSVAAEGIMAGSTLERLSGGVAAEVVEDGVDSEGEAEGGGTGQLQGTEWSGDLDTEGAEQQVGRQSDEGLSPAAALSCQSSELGEGSGSESGSEDEAEEGGNVVPSAEGDLETSLTAQVEEEGDEGEDGPVVSVDELEAGVENGDVDGRVEGEASGSEVPSGSLVGQRAGYEQTQQLLAAMALRVDGLERGLNAREQDLNESTEYIEDIKAVKLPKDLASTVLRQAEETARRMQLQLKAKEREVHEKDLVVQRLLQQTRLSQQKMSELETRSKGEREKLQRTLEQERQQSKKELEGAMIREEELRHQLEEAQEAIVERDSFLKQLQEEAVLSANALKQAARAMVAARERTLRVEEQLEMMGDELAREKESTARERTRSVQIASELAVAKMTIEELTSNVERLEGENRTAEDMLEQSRRESSQTRAALTETSQALSEAEDKIRELEDALEEEKEAVLREAQAAAAAAATVVEKDQLLQQAEERLAQLTQDVASLQEMVESKEKMMAAVREETVKNAELLMSAGKTRKELTEARRKIEHLQDQVRSLEGRVEQQDALLAEVKAEAMSSAEALRTASQIKQELNMLREKEAELQEELEAKERELQLLRRESGDSLRAQRAELALMEAERRAAELESERDTLRRGVVKRDQALVLMRKELERSAHMLSAAAETREALRNMKAQMDAMQNAAMKKEQRLAALQDEFVTALNNSTSSSQALARELLNRQGPIPNDEDYK